jgi:4-hydroxy-2-oxoheptanedioate aldolase
MPMRADSTAVAMGGEPAIAAGNAPGILTGVEEEARAYMDAGCLFIAVGSDAGLLARASEKIAQNFKS